MTPPRPRRPAGLDPSLDPLAPSEAAIQAILDGLDHLASEMERKWGVGRLRLLVDDDLRARFDAQKAKLDAAIAANRETWVRAQAEGMRRAWQALDKAATAAGAAPLAPEVWEAVLSSSGEVIAIVRTEAEAHLVARQQRVFTVDEIARLIDGLPKAVLEIKQVFPGATIAHAGPPDIDWEKGDEIPF